MYSFLQERKKKNLQKNCIHKWRIYDVIPRADSEGIDYRLSIYKLVCTVCETTEKRGYFQTRVLVKAKLIKNEEAFLEIN